MISRAIASNGLPLKYPRGHFDGDDTPDWTYRYTPEEGQTEAGKKIAIDRALSEARLTVW